MTQETATHSLAAVRPANLAKLAPLAAAARVFAAEARSPRTRSAYRAAWSGFAAWCAEHELAALPAAPETLALYLSARAEAGAKVASLAQALAAIGEAHRVAGQESPVGAPVARETWKGIRRTLGTAPRRVAPVVASDLRAMVRALPAGPLGLRDRALLVVGFAGAFRRSELVALNVADLAFTAEGVVVTVRRSKTDQEGAGATVGLPFGSDPATCPVRTLRAWLEAAGIAEGAVFRSVSRHGQVGAVLSGRDVARVVKRAAEGAGLEAARYSGHSLRAGLATTAAKAGKADRAIMAQGRWASRTMVDRYVRDARLLDGDNAAAGIGL